MGDEQMTQEQKGKTPVLDVQNLTKIYDNGGKGDGNVYQMVRGAYKTAFCCFGYHSKFTGGSRKHHAV